MDFEKGDIVIKKFKSTGKTCSRSYGLVLKVYKRNEPLQAGVPVDINTVFDRRAVKLDSSGLFSHKYNNTRLDFSSWASVYWIQSKITLQHFCENLLLIAKGS